MKKAIGIIVILITYISVYSQSPYTVFGDSTHMLTGPEIYKESRYLVIYNIDSSKSETHQLLFDFRLRQVYSFDNEGTVVDIDTIPKHIATRWLSVDPLDAKYPQFSPYNFVFNSPLIYIDPDGREGVVVSGQPGGHTNKKHFLINGLDRAKASQSRLKEGESTTWIIFNDGSKKYGHNPQQLTEYKLKAQKLGINVIEVSSSEEIVDYVNEKNGVDDSRSNDKVSNFYYVGHATPGDLEVGYGPLFSEYIEAGEFEADAFNSGCWVNVVGGCRTVVDGLFENSVVKDFQKIVDRTSSVSGSDVKVQYDGGVVKGNKLVKYINEDGTKVNGNIVTVNGKKE